MSDKNEAILEEANAAIAEGNHEGFLSFCADDIEWTFVGDKTLNGKEAVRRWMATAYVEPPKFRVANLIAEGDFVTALGDITIKDEDKGGSLLIWHLRTDLNSSLHYATPKFPGNPTKSYWLPCFIDPPFSTQYPGSFLRISSLGVGSLNHVGDPRPKAKFIFYDFILAGID
jgi:ketosteroid isomerase-like protein